MELVASSKIRRGGSASSARAKADELPLTEREPAPALAGLGVQPMRKIFKQIPTPDGLHRRPDLGLPGRRSRKPDVVVPVNKKFCCKTIRLCRCTDTAVTLAKSSPLISKRLRGVGGGLDDVGSQTGEAERAESQRQLNKLQAEHLQTPCAVFPTQAQQPLHQLPG